MLETDLDYILKQELEYILKKYLDYGWAIDSCLVQSCMMDCLVIQT